MPVTVTILGSGSSGNCTYLETGDTRILVDAGFSGRQIRQKLAGIGRTPETLTGILVTHEHSDHVNGLAALGGKTGIPVYANRLTRDAVQHSLEANLNWRIFETGTSFDIGDVGIDAFSIPHDAQDPVGFLLRTNAGNVGFLTDLGHVTRLVIERVRPSHVLVLESNHDVKLLQDDVRRPWSLKQRILSRHGHLSNEAAADAARDILHADLRHLYLGHLSRDCNRPELAFETMTRRLQELGATQTRVEVATQESPCATLDLEQLRCGLTGTATSETDPRLQPLAGNAAMP